eukprot:TRINITY_DN70301_c0_g1_i1.p1 TRINITY_DN70301_c0_g1~~TRINITY_DN70301_c0_g1_i1.p1  ORF type:complete len:231 (-),score=11.90 TRINITY_DN70301_c0_g1_i1:454-1146(-)
MALLTSGAPPSPVRDDARRSLSPVARVSRLAGVSRRGGLKPPEAPRPQLFILGEIEGAVPCWPLVRLYCSWRIVFDTSRWWVIQGDIEGETYASDVSSQGFCVWNHPVMVHLACKSVQGWPRLEFEVRGSDSHGRQQLAGYGTFAIPPSAGTTEVLCRCWRPAGEGFLGKLRAHLLGSRPELPRPAVLSDAPNGHSHGINRTGLSTEDSVDVLLRLSVIHQHFAENGLGA